MYYKYSRKTRRYKWKCIQCNKHNHIKRKKCKKCGNPLGDFIDELADKNNAALLSVANKNSSDN